MKITLMPYVYLINQEEENTSLIPNVYVMNQGEGRLTSRMFKSEEMRAKMGFIEEGMAEVWDECRDSANCTELLDERYVVINVQCLRYIQ